MATFLELTAIDLRAERRAYEDQQLREPLLDDLELPVSAPLPNVEVPTRTVLINVTTVREIGPRKGGKPGTRIVFVNGSAQIVRESFEEVRNRLLPTLN